jgi:outer membrane protein assembly factor BamD (BamD/ComL family)
MLIADVAQASGALDRAVAQYLEVAAEFDDLPVAESALYAAARIELHRSRSAAARAVLERYLGRFPTGRYADDARRELAHP